MKKIFFTGLVLLMPLALTVMILIFLTDLLTDPFLNIVKKILIEKQDWIQSPQLITFVARLCTLFVLFFFLAFLGFVARVFFIKWILNITHKILSKIPFVKPIYRITKDIVNAFFQQENKKAFLYPALIPFPSDKSYSIGFVSGEIPPVCIEKVNKKMTPVFVPTAPHPISGFMLMLPSEDVLPLVMTNEEAVKFTVSCGVILPEEKST